MWTAAKAFIANGVGLDRDGLHIIIALIVLLAVATLSRRPLAHPLPVATVLGICLADEVVSAVFDGTFGFGTIGSSARDVIVVMLAPMILFVVARFVPKRTTQEKGRSIKILLPVPPDYFRRRREIVDAEFEEISQEVAVPTGVGRT